MTISSITPIRADVTPSETKQQLLDTVAQTCDDMIAAGKEPVCIVFALVSETGAVRSGYHTGGAISDRNALHIARAVMTINVNYGRWDAT